MKRKMNYQNYALPIINLNRFSLRQLRNSRWFVFYSFVLFAVISSLAGCKSDDPKASFVASSEAVELGDTVYFTNNSSNSSYYQWTFGDGDAAVTKDASHSYTEAGTYTVKLVAIGDGNANTTSVDILVTGDVSIFPNVGITEVSLGDTWSAIDTKFNSTDTMHQDNSYSGGYYSHCIYYYELGIGIWFYNTKELDVNASDEAFEISVADSYAGYTAKGIKIGNYLSKVESAYGTPDIYTGSDYYYYYYDDLGIQFYTSSTSSLIGEIDVYAASSSSKSASVQKYKSERLSTIHKLREKLMQIRR